MKLRLIEIPILGLRWRALEISFGISAFAVFVFYFSLCGFRIPWEGDFHVYISAISALYADFSQPIHENMPVDIKYSLAYTPFVVITAAFGRMFSLSEYAALQWAGIFNLCLYAISILIYFRSTSLIKRSILPAVFFLIISLFLRDTTFAWSSETSFDTLRFIQAYPSFFAWSLALLIFASMEKIFVTNRPQYAALVAPLLWTLTLVHLITASWVIGIIGLRCLYEITASNYEVRRSLSPLIFSLVISVLVSQILTFLWPYSNLVELSRYVSVPENPPFGEGWTPITAFLMLYILALPSFYLLKAERRGRLLIVNFAATAGALMLFKALDVQYGLRYVFFMAFFAQVAVAEVSGVGLLTIARVVSELKDGKRNVSIGEASLITLTLATLTAVFQAPLMKTSWHELSGTSAMSISELWTKPNSANVYYTRYPELNDVLSEGNIVLVSPSDVLSYELAVLSGARSVVVGLSPIVPDYAARIENVNHFLTPNTPWTDRLTVIEKYGVSHILLTRNSNTLAISSELVAQLGPPLLESPTLILFRVQQNDVVKPP